ncbi:D-amino-acid oxidase [Aspergillus bombycis]|uniref:D-amino-acid oxidase n=1 Tax=Aspergillus bombycis TaxID=109264 RepID=A0A1F7ZL78_9EURO|nr:D-amino-acid oxidase [Aspergillus bombycis]OGM40171.1 D-amino-acid oxidase [Aspergillus bombycis]
MSTNNIVILGAGVSGLTTAYLLSKDASNSITVLAKHMPGDYDIEYASPWAGANYLPVGKASSSHGKWERNTWPALKEITEKYPEAGIHFQDAVVYNRTKDQGSATGDWFSELVQKEPWYKDVVPDFRNLPDNELAPGIDNASVFTSVCINTAIYLPWLIGQCRTTGVVFKRAVIKHVADAASLHHSGKKADVVVNCTGLSSKKLGGVNDDKLHPIRGQVVVVRNDPGAMFSISGTDDADDEITYMMTRAAGGGTVIGGSYQKDQWDPLPDPNLAVRIMKRAVALVPQLVGKGQGIEGLDVIRHGVGLRPFREDGPRIEADKVNGVSVVHNYGHGGFGYQASFGCAAEAVELVNGILKQKGRAKLRTVRPNMTYKPPKVEEDYSDASEPQKRKRDEKYFELEPITSEQEFETEKQQPPNKASKPNDTPAEEEEEELSDVYEEGDEDIIEEEDNDEDDEEVEEEKEDIEDNQAETKEEEEEDEEEEEEQEVEEEEDTSKHRPKVQKAIDKLGRCPLDGTKIAQKPLTASPETLLAMVIDAMLKSRPISHDLTQRTVTKVIDAGYHDIRKLGHSTWEERTTILKDGGYSRYREQGATNLGELAELVESKYDGDLNNLLEEAHHNRDEVRQLIKEIKGLGDLGADLFFNNVQSVWPEIAPFVDKRSLQTADQVGIGTDLDAIYADLKRDSMKMSRLANGLSAARLDKRQGELLSI